MVHVSMTTPFFLMLFLCCECICLVKSSSRLKTLFVHPLAMCDKLWEIASIDILCNELWETRFLDILHVKFWNAMQIDVLCIDVKFWDATSPLLLVPCFRAFEALCGRFWTNRSMVSPCCKINLWHVNFKCALSSRVQMGAASSLSMKNELALWEGLLQDENSLKSM
jgi:hypothetical protein